MKEKIMYRIRSRTFLISLFLCCIALLVAACGSSGTGSTATGATTPGSPPPSTGHTPTTVSGSPALVPGTVSMPPTLTSCPPAGTARAAALASLGLGSRQNIVYIVNQGPSNAPTLGTLKRYDVTTGNKTEILNLSRTYISEAQVSADGQWILFVAVASGQARLQLIRMDGQGLETLHYASPPSNGANTASSLHDVQWSRDQKLVIFDSYTSIGSVVDLLNMENGRL